jgi:hypothetical protein
MLRKAMFRFDDSHEFVGYHDGTTTSSGWPRPLFPWESVISMMNFLGDQILAMTTTQQAYRASAPLLIIKLASISAEDRFALISNNEINVLAFGVHEVARVKEDISSRHEVLWDFRNLALAFHVREL